jgi:Protein of unknown function (DUF1501)
MKKGIADPATTANTDTPRLRRWIDAPFQGDVKTFRPAGSNLVFGPGIGDLAEAYDRLCLVNGLAMNTVSHPDGTAFSRTGRHLAGGRAEAASLDTLLASELGTGRIFPVVSIQFPSTYAGPHLDRRAVPLVVGQIGTIRRALTRDARYDTDADRSAVTAILSSEAQTLAARSSYTDVLNGFALQYESLIKMLGASLEEAFTASRLMKAYPELDVRARSAGPAAINAAFAVEAFRRNIARCVSFSSSGFDTHFGNHRFHAQTQQEFFGMVLVLLRLLDRTPHPVRAGKKLSDHTHLFILLSDFCRTPQLNPAMGRDHYPNNSALVISPRFRSNTVFGKTDPEQLLPAPAKVFRDGPRPVAPPDLLATFLSAFGIPPRKYLRDGEVIPELLRHG